MTKKKEEKLLTDAESELMSILWRIGEGSVAEVIEQLPPGRDLAYTSVSTFLRILEQKKILKARKEGRGHIYIPLLSKAEYEERTLRHLVDKVFDGTPVSLARQLIATSNLTKQDIQELKALLKKAEDLS
jgi:predicted transcriptional regulator